MSALTSLLVRDGVVPVRKIEEALQRQVISGGDVETVLLEMDALPENVLAAYRAAVYELKPATREEVSSVAPEVVELVPRDVAVEHRIVPLRVEEGTLHVAAHEPLTPEQQERIGFLLGFDLVTHIACDVRIAAGLALHYEAELAPRMIRLVDRVRGRQSGQLPEVGKAETSRLLVHGADLPDKRAPASTAAYGTSRSGSFILEPAPPEPSDEEKKKVETVRRPTERTSFADLKRMRGPMTLPAGERMLKRASDRDQILEVFFAFARQFFDYTALFVVHDEVADGREAYGVGAPTEQVRALSVPLDVPSAFAEAVRTLAPQVRSLDQTEVDRDIALGLRRPATPPAMLMPIAIRQRVVLILYGDRDGELFDIGSAMELVRFGPRVVECLEQLIIRKKRAGYHAEGTDDRPDTEERAASKAVAKKVARRVERTSKVPTDAGAWRPGRRSSPGFEVPTNTNDESWGSVERAPSKLRTAETMPTLDSQPAPAPAAKPKKRKARRPPSQVLGIPRQAPPPPASAELDLGMLDLDGLGEDDEDEPEVSFGSDDDDEVVISYDEDFDDEDFDDEDFDDEDFDDDGDEADGDDADGDEADGDEEAGDGEAGAEEAGDEEAGEEDDLEQDDDDEDDTRERSGHEEEDERRSDERLTRESDRPDGAYSSKAAPVDVIWPKRRSDRPGRRTDRPPGRRSDRPSRSEKTTPRDRRRTDNAGPRPEVVRVPDSIRPEPRAPLPVDASRSVIVDMGAQVHAHVDDLLSARSTGEQDRLIKGILAIGEAALPVLAQAFPGPLTWTRESGGRVPRAADISPVARALVAFGPRASSYVAGLLSSGDPDVRLYAAIIASEMVSIELMDAVAERVHDDDQGVRRIAVQLMPRFAGFRGFEEIRTVLRRTARIRGKELSRRWQAIDALAELRDVDMIPKMVDLLREDDAELEKHLHGALVKLTCTDLGRSHRRWLSWWNRNRNRHRIEWLIDGLVHGHESIRRDAGDELKRLTQEYYGYHAGSPKRDRERIARKYREWWEAEGAQRFAQ